MKKFKFSIIGSAILFLVVFSGNALAEMKAGVFSLSPSVGGYVFDGGQNLSNGPVYGLGLGYNYTKNLGVEAVFNYIDTESESPNGGDAKGYIYRIDGLYHLMPDKQFVPYVTAGVGAITLDDDVKGSNTDPLFNYGVGFKYFLTEFLAFRGDIRHIYSFNASNNNFAYTFGLTLLFGGKVSPPPPAPAPQPSPPPIPEDSDGDGVYDDMDKCPGTPASVPVDSMGCPKDSDRDGVYDYMDKCPDTPFGTTVDSVGCPKKTLPRDSDGDGVYDDMDKCPGTPAGAPIDSTGCSKDSDKDGVYDYMDKCPDTPLGIKVDDKGCPVPIKEKVSIELKVEFDFDKSEIKSVYQEHLQKVANFLKAYPEAEAVIEGHTDNIGDEQYNLRLSQKRAENVRQYLIKNYGVDPSRLKAKGFGESQPIADNKTKEGRQRNRRVVGVISTIATK